MKLTSTQKTNIENSLTNIVTSITSSQSNNPDANFVAQKALKLQEGFKTIDTSSSDQLKNFQKDVMTLIGGATRYFPLLPNGKSIVHADVMSINSTINTALLTRTPSPQGADRTTY